jgi:hypothetical protein
MSVMMINPGLAVMLNNSWNTTRVGVAASHTEPYVGINGALLIISVLGIRTCFLPKKDTCFYLSQNLYVFYIEPDSKLN